ncbi:unnamed protein product [Adineta steineri]|uniref:G-protein coupled receptors family 1 profile domain-containing protein n=3 Tax=Adineta steineri TaxID=433720 RepID=A0A815BSE9_9BILA|nr:unnamed protein product [Adineta steineri]CAF1274000.1 unnamed protein product [Adineta steineri]
MSSSNTTNDLASAVSNVTQKTIMFTRYWCMTMFILGLIGHSLNVCIFTRPALRLNPCARYFMASAIAGYGVIFGVLPVRLLQFGYSRSLFLSSVTMCKMLTFLFSWARILPCWFIGLASIDRFLCSSPSMRLRGWSSIRVFKYLITLAILFTGLTQMPILIFFTISSQPAICLGQPNLFQKLNGFFILIVWSLIPSLTMFIFGFLTIRHIQQSIPRVHDENIIIHHQKRTKFIDRQLIQMTLMQSILFGLTSAAGAIGGTFNVLDDNSRKDALELAKQSLIGNVLSFVGLFGPCLSFYSCTLSSQLFRHELMILLHVRKQHEEGDVTDALTMQERIN